jgi:hypothetical protein
LVLYVQAITKRKRAESGAEEGAVMPVGIPDLLDLIEKVKKEQKEHGRN